MNRPLPFDKSGFPQQTRPLFEFLIDEDGKIQRKEYYFYMIYTGPRHTEYRIYKGPSAIATKRANQLNEVRNNRLFTFNPDIDRAKSMFIGHYTARLEDAKAAVKKYESALRCLS